MQETAISLLNEVLNLAVRARNLGTTQRKLTTSAASVDPEALLLSGRFDAHVARNNINRPHASISTKSGSPQLWVDDQYNRDLHDWEARVRKFLTSEL